MLRKFVFSLMAVLALSLVAMAQGDRTTLTGYIIDKACSARLSKKNDPQAAAAEEPTSCALMEGCIKSGFGIFADGKYIAFDEKGGALAKAALEKSKKDKGAKFKVTGKLTGDKLTVEKIQEVM